MKPHLHIFCSHVIQLPNLNTGMHYYQLVRCVERAPDMTLPGGAGCFCMIGHVNTDTP
jgi:hypothetical protein